MVSIAFMGNNNAQNAGVVLSILTLLIIGSIFTSSSSAQNPTPNPTPPPINTTVPIDPSTNISPTITALQEKISRQQIEIESLRQDLDYEVRERQWWFTVAIVIAAFLGISGFQAWTNIGKQVRRKTRIMVNKYYYQLDVTNLDFHVRTGEQQDKLIDLLQSQGLYRIRRFEKLDTKSLQGITIFSIENEEDEKDYTQYIYQYYTKQKRLNSKKAAFLLYVPSKYRLEIETIELYPSTSIANTSWTLISAAFFLGRHITVPPKIDDEDEEE